MHWFGVDPGRDIFSRVLVGRRSRGRWVLVVLIGAAIGTALGLLAGYS